ncbi:UPF0149 family protein [Sphingomonas sp. CLY1604]|uniref:UPF0149 family protein n=1 Tax=Sphingomonas sp. CLY1604 TaxID=3457786 RepID=UPI003FD7C7D8
MKQLPSRLRRLDDALADLPLDEPMLLTELDGFLHGVIVCPDPIPPAEWLQNVWGVDDGGVPAFDDPADVQWFVDAVMARYQEILRDLARGKPRPILDVDERNGDVLWELWIDGFAEAMELRGEHWAGVADGDDAAAADALARLELMIAVARNESDLDSQQINALQDHAPADLMAAVASLHAARVRAGGGAAPAAEGAREKIGRNDPCRCGSGKKAKRCCGAD